MTGTGSEGSDYRYTVSAIFDFPGRFVNDYLDPEAKGVGRAAWEVVTAGETPDCPITIVC